MKPPGSASRWKGLFLMGVVCLAMPGGGCRHAVDPAEYATLCESLSEDSINYPWHLVLFVDIESCLACNEDMDAWRVLVTKLRDQELGSVTVFAPETDWFDAFWAMKLEGISDTVHVLDNRTIKRLRWKRLGTPVKVLLDSLCRPVEVGGWMGNSRQSREFIESLISRIAPEEVSPGS